MSEQLVYYVISVTERGFTFGARMPPESLPQLGSLVKTRLDERLALVGLIHRIEIQGNEITRAMSVHAGLLDPAEIEYHRSRLVPVIVEALSLGYLRCDGEVRAFHLPPPRLPVVLGEVHALDADEMRCFTQESQPIFETIATFLSDRMVELASAMIARVAGDDRERRVQLCRALVLAWSTQLDKADAVVRRIGGIA
ncbi:MAG: hypothetical protein NZL91_07050 [Thermoflexales bacterium]|nr:hypothetical protein [Thermoflexales bacterium]MCS7324230.1 hypothetical protein [Thermoflexales bacterium]MDW8053613.1 hypothetical protein [Anaerolineae bacterium]MDW8292097.1 hypothetical protein [Anaerolineae bacterium]